MASANTSLNGYEFGRTPKTTAPFWAGGGEGAVIDDTGVYSDRTWSSQKINNELSEKADADDVYAKNETYTKAEVDALIEAIEPSVDAYTKAETDTLLDAKADKATTYTKSEVDALISDIPAIDAYTKSQTDALLETKAAVTSVYMKSETYSKSEVDALIEGVSPTPTDAYTKAQTDALLATKANAADVYTKTQTNNLLNGKADSFNVYDKRATDRLLADKANAADVYTKTQTDDLLHDKADVTDVYTKAQTDSLLANKADASELASYAKATSVYTKTQTYTKAEVDALIAGAGGGVSYAKTKFSPYAIQGIQYMEGNSEQFSHNNYLWYMEYNNGSRFPVTITYDDSTTETIMINGDYFDVPWNETPLGSNYPSETAPYKPFVYGDLTIKMCLTNNVLVDDKYFADVILIAECAKGVSSIAVNIEHTPMVVSMGGTMNICGTPESVYVDGNAILYAKQANNYFYRKYEIDNKIGLQESQVEYNVHIDSNYRGELLNASSFGNQVEIAFKLKSGISFTANSMLYIGYIDVSSTWLNLNPLTSMVNGFVYNDSNYFIIDGAGCVLMKPTTGSTAARIYLGFKSNYTSDGHEIIRFSFMGKKADS